MFKPCSAGCRVYPDEFYKDCLNIAELYITHIMSAPLRSKHVTSFNEYCQSQIVLRFKFEGYLAIHEVSFVVSMSHRAKHLTSIIKAESYSVSNLKDIWQCMESKFSAISVILTNILQIWNWVMALIILVKSCGILSTMDILTTKLTSCIAKYPSIWMEV